MRLSFTFRIWAVLALLIQSTVAAVVAEGKEDNSSWLEPTSAWQVDYADADCKLLRQFGSGDERVVLELRRSLAFDNDIWSLYGTGIPTYTYPVNLNLTLEPQHLNRQVEAQPYRLVDHPEKILKWVDIDRSLGSQMRDDQTLRIGHGNRIDVGLRLPGMAKAIQALAKCHDDLFSHWGMTSEYRQKIKVKPEPANNAGRWATNDDYPSADRAYKNEGTTTFLLSVSSDGKTTECRIVGSSGFASLDERTCELMRKRAVFHPARDAAGKPVESYYVNRVRWQLPR